MIKIFTDEKDQISYIVNIESDSFDEKLFFLKYFENFEDEISEAYHNIDKFYKAVFNTDDFKILYEKFIDIAFRMKISHFVAIQLKVNYQDVYTEVCKSIWEQTAFDFCKNCKCYYFQEYSSHQTKIDIYSDIIEKVIGIAPLYFLYKKNIKFKTLKQSDVIISSVPKDYIRYDSVRE